MRIRVISFTEQGKKLGENVFSDWTIQNDGNIQRKVKDQVELCTRADFDSKEAMKHWIGVQFSEGNALVFIGACGIAVRLIAPFIQDKSEDSPVLVMDEGGQFVIPILSGHLGGANELAERIAEKAGILPVITTATDVRRTFAADLFAKQNDLTVVNPEGIARVSSKLLSGKMADIVIAADEEKLSCGILKLKPKEYVLGAGCKKGKSYEELDLFFTEQLKRAGIEKTDLFAVASIDLKKEEEGLVKWAAVHRIPLLLYSSRELELVKGEFSSSGFVKNITGVDNICERAAMKAAGEAGKLILAKQKKDGMTAAVAKRKWKLDTSGKKGFVIDEA